MSSNDVWLNRAQMAFIKKRFKEKDPEKAIDKCIEYLTNKGLNPFKLDVHITEMMARENN